jgi:thymidylate synthase
VAEEVEKLNPDLVARDAQGRIYTVRYEAVNAMLLNEFLKEHRRVQQLEKVMENLSAAIKSQDCLLQEVNARVQATPAAPMNSANHQ